MAEKRSWGRRLWGRLETIHTLVWLWDLAVAAWAAWGSRKFIPHRIGPADYWLPIAVFFGSLAVVVTLTQFARAIIGRIRMWRHPPSLTIMPHGGTSATVEITHFGLPTVWEARIRILDAGGQPNPDPRLRQCYLLKDGQCKRALRLEKGEIASIELAAIRWSHPLSTHRITWVSVPNPDDEHDTRIGNDSVIEANFTTNPVIQKLAVRKCFKVSRTGDDVMTCVEVPAK
jgi:hypothetical protein